MDTTQKLDKNSGDFFLVIKFIKVMSYLAQFYVFSTDDSKNVSHSLG